MFADLAFTNWGTAFYHVTACIAQYHSFAIAADSEIKQTPTDWWLSHPSEKYFQSVGITISNIWKNTKKKGSTNHIH